MYLRFRHSDVGVRWSGGLQFMCCGVAGGCNSGITSGVARPGPTRACALPSAFQALPSAAQHDSHDSIKN